MQFIDVHCHYEDDRFNEDRDEVISSLPFKNVLYAISAGCSAKESIITKEIAEKYEHMYFCAGVHPCNADKFSETEINILKDLWQHEKCVAVGEAGLDYYWAENPEKSVQKNTFIKQIHFAKEYNLPIVIHSREAIGDMLEIIKSEQVTNGLMHCFSESNESAKICLDQGLYFSFGGVCTFKNSVRAQENLKYIPKDRIVLETDSPYLAPVPNRSKRNDSTNIIYIIEHIAMLWNMTPEEVADITTQNAKRLFTKLK